MNFWGLHADYFEPVPEDACLVKMEVVGVCEMRSK